MNYRQLLLLVLINVSLISLIFAAKVTTSPKPTTPKSATTTKPKTKTNSTNNLLRVGGGTRKVITTRLGADGNPEAACECTVFYLCDKDNVVTLPSTSVETCDSSSICCSVPIQSLGEDTYNPSTSTSSSTNTPIIENTSIISQETPSPIPNSGESCVCVPFYQCRDYDPLVSTAGAGLIDPKIPCEAPDVCCPASQVSPGGGNTPSEPTVIIPPTQTPINPPVSPDPVTVSTDPIPVSSPTPPINPEECGIRRGQSIDARMKPGNGLENRIGSGITTPTRTKPGKATETRIALGKTIDNRIASDSAQQPVFGEFPWMALILTTEIAPNGTKTENVFVCGASILSPSIILTAAHCVNEVNISLLKIRVGEYNTHQGAAEPLPHQDRPVSAIHVHPNFNARVLFNDLALLSVNEPFQLAAHISPICAPMTDTTYGAPNSYNPNQCLASGWGKNAFSVDGDFQTILKKVDLSIVPRDQCQTQLRETRLGQFFQLDNSFICAGGQPGYDTCQGDGGGPLFCASYENPNRYIQVGIVSWGIGCANNVPGVYASLEANKQWLTTEFNSLTVFKRA